MSRIMLSMLFCSAMLLSICGNVKADLVTYDGTEAGTAHLFQFNETTGTTSAATVGGVTLNSNAAGTLGTNPTNLDDIYGTAGTVAAGTGSFGFLSNADVTVDSLTGANGAFTLEAIVSLNINANGDRFIIGADQNGPVADRPFQFRIQDGNLQFTKIAGGVEEITVALPTLGDDAFVAGDFFHAAVVYSGDELATGNLEFFFTSVDGGATVANSIGTGTLTADIEGSDFILGIGDSQRANSGNLDGIIDEARISSVARGAGDFIFTTASAVPEPSSLALLGLGAVVGLVRRRKS